MRVAIRTHRRDFMAIVGLVAVALAVGGYILSNQRLRFPVIEPKPFELKAAFATAQAVTPGQGQTVRVAGVRVGDISRAELVDGHAVITLQLDHRFRDLVHTDARALLRPKTGLKDMFVELDPGTPRAQLAHPGWTLPISSTLPDVNPHEILAGLDADTRDHPRPLPRGAGQGLHRRGDDLRDVLRRFEPTYRDLAAVNGEVRKRRADLRHLVWSLDRLNTTLGAKDDDLAQLVDSASRVFSTLADERRNVAATVHELPSTLRQATSTLGRVETMARELGPTTERMRPVMRALRAANVRTRAPAPRAPPPPPRRPPP